MIIDVIIIVLLILCLTIDIITMFGPDKCSEKNTTPEPQTKKFFGLTPKEFKMFTHVVDKDVKLGDGMDVVAAKRLSAITKLDGKYYVYYKKNTLIDIVDIKKDFNKYITFEAGFLKDEL